MPKTILRSPLERIFITQVFGVSPAIYGKFGLRGHNGGDFRTAFPNFTPKGHMHCFSMKPGVVIEARNQDIYIMGIRVKRSGYGLHFRVRHDDGSQSVYGHMEKLYIKVGDRVSTDTICALTGNSGFSTGPHLHVGYRPPGWEKMLKNGFAGYVDFLPFLVKR